MAAVHRRDLVNNQDKQHDNWYFFKHKNKRGSIQLHFNIMDFFIMNNAVGYRFEQQGAVFVC